MNEATNAHDNYKDEFLLQLEKSLIYQRLFDLCNKKDQKTIDLVHEAVSFSIERSKLIVSSMPEYTLHDSVHLFKVLNIIEKLLGKNNINNLHAPEALLIILSVFFHDLGMAPNQEYLFDFKNFLNGLSYSHFTKSPEQNLEFDKFLQFHHSRPDLHSLIHKYPEKREYFLTYFIAEFIRSTHAFRVRDVIEEFGKEKIKYRDTEIYLELANICESHNLDAKMIKDFEQNKSFGNDEYANIAIIAILLRIADILDFDMKRAPKVLLDNLFITSKISIQEWQKHRAIQSWQINTDTIKFTAKCSHPIIQYSINSFCNDIETELSVCNSLLSQINLLSEANGRNLLVKLPFLLDRTHIETEKDLYNKPKFIYQDTKFELSKSQILDILMGTKLYGRPEYALRELIQNSLDACQTRKELSEECGEFYQPKIEIKYYQDGYDFFLEVNDNGIGMDLEIIQKFYSKIGNSYYKSPEYYRLKKKRDSTYKPISRFGIGILSTFMISDVLSCETRRMIGNRQYSAPLKVNIEGQDSIFYITESERAELGTNTKLLLRSSSNPWIHIDFSTFNKQLQELIIETDIQIEIEFKGNKIDFTPFDFHNYDFQQIKSNYGWYNTENVKSIEFNFKENEFTATCVVGVLQQNSLPANSVEIASQKLNLNGIDYEINKKISSSGFDLINHSASIGITDLNQIISEPKASNMYYSHAKVAFNGIEVPHNILDFIHSRKSNLAYLYLPFPTIMLINIYGGNELDINSARTEIMAGDRWDTVCTNICLLFCRKIKNQVNPDYWDKFVVLCKTHPNSQNYQIFNSALDKFISDENKQSD